IAFCGSFAAFLALPFGDGIVAFQMNIAVFYMLAVMSTEVFGIILAGYGSGSKWSLFGGMREAAQMVSYEVPMAICVLVPVIVAVSGIAVLLFLGGWNAGVFPGPTTEVFSRLLRDDRLGVPIGFAVGNMINVLVFVLKGWVLVFVMMWVRWTLPRLRIDQVMM